MRRWGSWLGLLTILLAGLGQASGQTNLAFQPDPENGYYRFDTGALRGRLRLNGKYQGMIELVDVATGAPVALGGAVPGLFSYYRVLGTDARYGHEARDWPTENRLRPDGALESRYLPASDHPLDLTVVMRWSRPDTLDVETRVCPQQAMPRFEVFVSSYFPSNYQARVYLQPGKHGRGQSQIVSADASPLVEGTYLAFPRDRESAQCYFDRRWEFPPNPVQWSVTRHLAAPLAMRRDAATGLAAVFMAPPEDCFGVVVAYNRTPPDNVTTHYSLYLSLFGRDLAAGQTAVARTRLVVGKIADDQAIKLYGEYLDGLKQGGPAPGTSTPDKKKP